MIVKIDARNGVMTMAGVRKHTLIVAAILLCTALLGSFLFIGLAAGHHCTHDDDCAVCASVDMCIHTLTVITAVFAAVFMAVRLFSAAGAVRCGSMTGNYRSTLVTMKTELRN